MNILKRTKKYIKKSYKKLNEDFLAKVIYDLIKFLLLSLLTLFIVGIIPKDFTINVFIRKKIYLSIYELFTIVSIFSMFIVAIYFFINEKKFNIIVKDLYTDEITGLLNHKAFQKDLEKYIKQNKVFSLIEVDVDNINKIKITEGKAVRNILLKKVGNLLKFDKYYIENVYRNRYGGDEFIIIVKENLETASKIATIKKDLIYNTAIKVKDSGKSYNLTICCGVTEFVATDTSEEILDRLSEALWQAKSVEGKNSISQNI